MPDPNLIAALEEIKAVLKKHDVAALVMLESVTHSMFLREFTPSWSCTRIEKNSEGQDVLRVRAMRADFESKEKHEKAVTDSVSMIVGFLEMLEQEKENMQRMVKMLGHHFEIRHVSQWEDLNESD